MKQKLLFLFLFAVLPFHVFSQAVANTAPDLYQCGNEVFDLTQQNALILGNQDPAQFTVGYFESMADADANANALAAPTVYISPEFTIIYARVTNTSDNTYAVTSFQVSWEIPFQVADVPDVSACGSYSLLPVFGVSYSADEAGTIAVPSTIMATMTIYRHLDDFPCSIPSSFTVTINPIPVIPDPIDVAVCDAYTLPVLAVGTYHTASGGAPGTEIPAATPITTSQEIYIYAESGTTPNCSAESSFHVTVINSPADPLADFVVCDTNADGYASFDLDSKILEILNGQANLLVTFYETQADADADVMAINSPYFNIIPFTQTIYVRRQDASGECYSVTPLQLVATPCGTITGTIHIDTDANGCTVSDPPAANIQVVSTNGNAVAYAFTNSQGVYTFNAVPQGVSAVNVIPGTQGTVSPGAQSFNVTGNGNYTADFCITPAAAVNDVALYFVPAAQAVPGFASVYYLYIRNNGNTVLDGTAFLNFNDSKLTFMSADPVASSSTGNSLTFSFSGLLPDQVKIYTLQFMVMTPPATNIGDLLYFYAEADPTQIDDNPTNDTATFNQDVVGSFDPNDKTVFEPVVDVNTDQYLHYLVRFQNTGTSEAANVTITDQLDENLDWSTFRPALASHNYATAMDGNGKVTFTFNDINLPAGSVNEPDSHGYVMYEARLKPNRSAGDDVYNTANIYFDFNAPVATNTVVTSLMVILGVDPHPHPQFALYPNPAKGTVNIQIDGNESFGMELLDITGKKILKKNADGTCTFDVSALQSGIYFVRITTDDATVTKKLIVK